MFQFTNTKGQGLMETIVAIGVILTGLVGAISLVNFTLQSSTTTLNRLIALNLSWEAVEAVVNIRDSNFLADLPYNTDLDGGADNSAILTFDEPSNVWFADFGPNSMADDTTRMYLQGGLYRQAVTTPAGSGTPFKRLVIFDSSIVDQLKIVSTVQWSERSNIRQVSSERVLHNWRGVSAVAPPPPPPSPTCNDGVLDVGEDCDPGVSASQSCTTVDSYSGSQSCSATTCTWNSCVATEFCGDIIINGAETCEPPNIGLCSAVCLL